MHSLKYDHETMTGLSDHVLVIAKLRASINPGSPSKTCASEPRVLYKWVDGTGVSNYAKSAQSWLEFTQRPGFVESLQTIVNATDTNNDERAAAVETFILQ
jgi:hypothetical protein